jgi:6-phosphogluconolactonase (cycloisomerase 2 family)
MEMRFTKNNTRQLRLAFVITLSAAVFLVAGMPAWAAQNLVYTVSNNTQTNQNSVIALVNDGLGNLSPVTGSPFLTSGTGVGPGNMTDAQWNSDGEVITNAAGTLLFAVNGHTNTIAAFSINADGSLTAVPGSPFPSGGTQPASIAYKDNALGNGNSIMIVANKDSDPLQTQTVPNYTTFSVSSTGVITPLSQTVTLPAGASPAQVIYRRGGTAGFFGVEFLAGTLTSYKLDRFGSMSMTNQLSLPGPSPVAVGGVLHPKVKGLYLTLPADHQIGVYGYDSKGKLFPIGTASNLGLAVCWAAINAAGTRLYTSETPSGTVEVYDITDPKKPTMLQYFTVSGSSPLAQPAHMHFDVTEKFLYVLDRNGVLHVLNVASDGTLTETITPYNLGLPAGTVPLGLAVLSK